MSWRPGKAIDIGILLALKEELDLFLQYMGSYTTLPPDRLPGVYYSFEIAGLNLVARQIGNMGMLDAARCAHQMLDRFSPPLLILVGLAGALDKSLKLGDVVVASAIDHYLHAAKAAGEDVFDLDLSGRSWPAPSRLLDVIRNFDFIDRAVYTGWLEEARTFTVKHGEPTSAFLRNDSETFAEPEIQVGPIASGDILGSSDAFSAFLLRRNRKYLALEMEAAGPANEAEGGSAVAAFLTVRGISDYCDAHKRTTDAQGSQLVSTGYWRQYALHNAASFLQRFLSLPHFQEELNRLRSTAGSRGHISGLPIMQFRDSYPRMDTIFQQASRQLIVCGINLDGTIPCVNTLCQQLNQGVRVQLLALDPDGKNLEGFAAFSNVNPDRRRNRIRSNLDTIITWLRDRQDTFRAPWEVRVLDAFMSMGCVGLDIFAVDDEIDYDGMLIVQHHNYHITADKAPVVTLTNKDNSAWYQRYVVALQAMWRSSRPYTLP